MAKNEVAEKQSTEVVNWEEKLAQEARDVAKTERPSINKINFQSGVMTYMDNAVPDNKLDCIIVASAWEHVFYDTPWEPGVVHPPACFALGVPQGDEPPIMQAHESVPSSPGPICSSCEMFKFGSDLKGGRGKACSERRRLAAIPNVTDPDMIEKAEMAVMSIPVMSVKNWANYINTVAVQHSRPAWGMLTRVSLVPDKKSQFKVTFEAVDKLDNSFLGAVSAKIPMATQALLTPYEVQRKKEVRSTRPIRAGASPGYDLLNQNCPR
jgi:hypothetical protein